MRKIITDILTDKEQDRKQIVYNQPLVHKHVRRTKTNRDWLNSLSNEDLVRLVFDDDEFWKKAFNCPSNPQFCYPGRCRECMAQWLNTIHKK